MNELRSKGARNCLLTDRCAGTCLEDRVETLWWQAGRTFWVSEPWRTLFMIGEYSVSMPPTYFSWCPGLPSEPRFYSSERAYNGEMHPGMHRTWEFSHCDGFDCPHCGAVYSVRYTQLPIRDSESAYCENCHRKMSQWHSTARPCYSLIARPERHHGLSG